MLCSWANTYWVPSGLRPDNTHAGPVHQWEGSGVCLCTSMRFPYSDRCGPFPHETCSQLLEVQRTKQGRTQELTEVSSLRIRWFYLLALSQIHVHSTQRMSSLGCLTLIKLTKTDVQTRMEPVDTDRSIEFCPYKLDCLGSWVTNRRQSLSLETESEGVHVKVEMLKASES